VEACGQTRAQQKAPPRPRWAATKMTRARFAFPSRETRAGPAATVADFSTAVLTPYGALPIYCVVGPFVTAPNTRQNRREISGRAARTVESERLTASARSYFIPRLPRRRHDR